MPVAETAIKNTRITFHGWKSCRLRARIRRYAILRLILNGFCFCMPKAIPFLYKRIYLIDYQLIN